jgi:hypothetical protein
MLRLHTNVLSHVAMATAAAVFGSGAVAAGESIERVPSDRLSLNAAEQLLRQHRRELRASQRAFDAAQLD